jgi:ketosteroid isomerase-like protein
VGTITEFGQSANKLYFEGPMSTEGDNVRLTRRLFDRWNSGDHEIDPELIDREFELHTPLGSSRAEAYQGYEGVGERVAEVERQFETLRFEIDEMRELDDDRVLASGVAHVRGRGSDIEVDQPLEWLLTFRRGRLLRYEAFVDEEANPAGVE